MTKRAKWKATETKPESDQRAEAKLTSLWRGLQLSESEAPAEMSERELIRELKKRVTDAGLNCRLLKLIPHADAIVEAEDECEFPSGHMVFLLAIGEAALPLPLALALTLTR